LKIGRTAAVGGAEFNSKKAESVGGGVHERKALAFRAGAL
jgi:hypothetical protein